VGQHGEHDVLEELVLDSMGSLGILLDQLLLDIWRQPLVQLVQHGCIGRSIVELVGSSVQLVDPSGCKLEQVDSSEQLVDPNDYMLVQEHGEQHYHRLGIQGTLIEKLFY
jgi:hypothetical protein